MLPTRWIRSSFAVFKPDFMFQTSPWKDSNSILTLVEFGFSLNEVLSFQDLILHLQHDLRNDKKEGTSIQLHIMQLVHNVVASLEAQDKELKRLEKLEECDTLHNKQLLLLKQLLKSKTKASKKIKTKACSCPQIKKEKTVSYCAMQYIYIYILILL
jgi:hypothetical protein